MARVTVEDCLDNVDNRFELVLVASKRAREIAIGGKTPHVAIENDKPTVVALREIADGYVTADILKQKAKPIEEPSELEVSEEPEETTSSTAFAGPDQSNQ